MITRVPKWRSPLSSAQPRIEAMKGLSSPLSSLRKSSSVAQATVASASLVSSESSTCVPSTTSEADATVLCATDDDFRKLLKGELNPFIASMRGWALLKGDRHFGTRVIMGLRAGSPFAAGAGEGA